MDWATLPLRKYADFTGRARRKEFWLFMLLIVVGSVIAATIDGLLGMSTLIGGLYGPVTFVLALALVIPQFSAGIRRLHDTGRSGWWILLSFVPIVGWLVLLYFFILDGTRGANAYGPDPKGGEAAVPSAT